MTIEEFKKLNRKRSKYNAEICEHNGIKYDSRGEMEYAIKLEWRQRSGEIKEIWRQVPIRIVVADVFICLYVIDFKVEYANGAVEYHEYKGYETDVWKLKWKLVQALYPEWKFILIKK